MFLCDSRLPSFASRRAPLRASVNHIPKRVNEQIEVSELKTCRGANGSISVRTSANCDTIQFVDERLKIDTHLGSYTAL